MTRRLLVHAVVLCTVIASSSVAVAHVASQDRRPVVHRSSSVSAREYRFERLTSPWRTVVRDERGVVATFTDGARTVVITGPARTFSAVATSSWVRLAPQPWTAASAQGAWLRPWLDKALEDRTEDVLAVAAHYLPGAERDASAALDAAGYVRLVYGYSLPRTPAEMAVTGTAVPADRLAVQPGDLLVFSGPAEGSVGIFFGLDQYGHARYVSSRKRTDGPAFGGDAFGRHRRGAALVAVRRL
ncbi:NlpC/P60 family protein [Lentzea sp. CA-135723]|uniref:NlpC/P60 family protein n=1 Tax=Lentzea sp. CA-135723 TaxID=3239950 RepID=UPI003D8E368A